MNFVDKYSKFAMFKLEKGEAGKRSMLLQKLAYPPISVRSGTT